MSDFKNSEGYPDPTPYMGIRDVENERRQPVRFLNSVFEEAG